MSYTSQFMGHIATMSYKYCQLDIKADVTSLLDVEIYIGDGEPKRIEDVAYIIIPEDREYKDRIEVYPKSQDYIVPIMQALYEEHPLVKYTTPEVEEEGRTDDQEPFHYILMTMPDMTKERKDATEDIVDALYDQCKMRIERTYTQYTARITRSASSDPQALQQQLDQLKESRANHLDMATQLKDDVYKDIEKAYAKYQADSDAKKKTPTTSVSETIAGTADSITF